MWLNIREAVPIKSEYRSTCRSVQENESYRARGIFFSILFCYLNNQYIIEINFDEAWIPDFILLPKSLELAIILIAI